MHFCTNLSWSVSLPEEGITPYIVDYTGRLPRKGYLFQAVGFRPQD